MKPALASIGLLLLCSSVSLAGELQVAADLSAFLSSLGAGGSCPTFIETAGPITPQSVTCSADCGLFPDVSCTGSGSCFSVDRNCAQGERGFVECQGNRTYCPSCSGPPPECGENDERYVDTGFCCVGGYVRYSVETCINGRWEATDEVCDGVCLP